MLFRRANDSPTMHTHDQAEIKPQRLRVVITTHELQVTSSRGRLQAAGLQSCIPTACTKAGRYVCTCSIAIDRLCSKYRIFAPRFTGSLLRGFASRLDGQYRRRCRLFHPALSVNRTDGDADPSVQPRRRTGHCSTYSLAFQCRCNHVTVRGKMRQCSDNLVLACRQG
jgi:hypothetical protein